MALSIKSDEADRLARELAAETGESLTEAVMIALQERLVREHARRGPQVVKSGSVRTVTPDRRSVTIREKRANQYLTGGVTR